MKHLFILLIITIAFSSCSKTNSPDCIDVFYDEHFTIQEGNNYCFPDGNSIEIKQLKNEFCPCDAVCVWEGQMMLNYTLIYDGNTYKGTQGSTTTQDEMYDTLDGLLHTHFQEIQLIEPCDENHPNPNIKNAQLKLTKL